MAQQDLNFDIQIDRRAMDFFKREAPEKLKEARKRAVEAMGMVWADEAKNITTNENHIDTGLYVNSIGYVTGSPATQSDVIHNLNESSNKTELAIGSNVAYAGVLERRYSIMARALDHSEGRMKNVASTQVKNTLGL